MIRTRSELSGAGEHEGPPVEFVEAVKHALAHLYDVAALSQHPLLDWGVLEGAVTAANRAPALRRYLIDAIERVRPAGQPTGASRQWRAFHVLQLRYVEALPYREVMDSLALSQTQYHREQRRAVETLATYLWNTHPRLASLRPAPEPRDARADADRSELLPEDPAAHVDDDVSLRPFLEEVIRLMTPLAAKRGVRLQLVANDDVAVATSRTALRHAVISGIGWLIERAESTALVLRLDRDATVAHVRLWLTDDPIPAQADTRPSNEKLELGQQLMRSLGGSFRVAPNGVGITLSLPLRRLVLLVIDDNPDLTKLIVRYLADEPFTVLSAQSVDEGIALARRCQPDVVLLDIMMPHQDGWDALQLLRYHAATAEIPVIVCTVLGEQQLAETLGATAFIRKPLQREALLEVLHQCLFHQSSSAEGTPASPGPPAASPQP